MEIVMVRLGVVNYSVQEYKTLITTHVYMKRVIKYNIINQSSIIIEIV